MKKKLNIYCVLFILALILGNGLDFAFSFSDMKRLCSEGIAEVKDNMDNDRFENYNVVGVTFHPKVFFGDSCKDSVYNEITKEKEAVYYSSIMVQVPKEKSSSSMENDTLSLIGSIIAIVGNLGFWVIFFITIRSVKRGNVFLLSVSSYLTKAAIFLFVAYVGDWMISWGAYNYAKEMVEIANYEIAPDFIYSSSKLYIGFGLLLLAQIIKHGKELKDENELTI